MFGNITYFKNSGTDLDTAKFNVWIDRFPSCRQILEADPEHHLVNITQPLQ